jgi:hypothetical protein
MSWLDDLLGKTIMANGVIVPDRKLLNFRSGVDVEIADNPVLQSTDVFIYGASYVRAFGSVLGSVNIGSGNDDDELRPPVLTDGDYTAYPFQHIAAAVAALPLHLGGFTLRLDISAGTYPGLNFGGFIGGVLQLIGSWATPTLTSGATSGTAGAGSAGSAVNKPTAADPWTASNLIGKRLIVTGGGGFTGDDALTEVVRTIKANTTTQITLDQSIPGLDATTTFEIVTEGTIINTAAPIEIDGESCLLGIGYCQAELVLRRIKLANSGSPADNALITTGTRLVDLGGMNIDGDWLGHEVDRIELNSVTIGGEVDLTNGGRIDGTAYLTAAGCFTIEAFGEAIMYLVARGCTNTALRVLHSNYVGREIDAADCTATPFELINVQYSEPVGDGLTGANPSAPFAAMVTAGGRHMFTGDTMTGELVDPGDPPAGNRCLDLDSYAVSWASLADRNYSRAGTFAMWSDDRWSMLGQFRIVNDSSTPFDDLQLQSMQIEIYKKEYSADRALPTTNTDIGDYSAGAYAEVVAAPLGTLAAATVIGSQVTKIVTCASAGHSVRGFDDTEKPGTGFGTHGEIWNMTANNAAFYAPGGKAAFLNNVSPGTDIAITLLANRRYAWFTDRYGNWYVDGP